MGLRASCMGEGSERVRVGVVSGGRGLWFGS
jgi:hypothetical protein